MELLLNLVWLLLALPAYWLWHARKRTHRRGPVQFLLALACMFVVLFPVISATDDLCAMRADLEESSAGMHSVRQNSQERLSGSKWQTQPALPSTFHVSLLGHYAWLGQPTLHVFAFDAQAELRSGRAPPSVLHA